MFTYCKGDAQIRVVHELDHGLKIVDLLARDAHLLVLNLGLHLDLEVLDHLDDALGHFLLYAFLDAHHAAHLSLCRGFGFAEVQGPLGSTLRRTQ